MSDSAIELKPSPDGDRGKPLVHPELAQRAQKAAGPWTPWPAPELSTSRRWLIVPTLIIIIGLYAWGLSHYWAGAHSGVDQNGYLVTARLIAGEYNEFAPPSEFRPGDDEIAKRTADRQTAMPQAAATQGASATAIMAAAPATQPSALQRNPRWDWLRNRVSYVLESPFQFAGRMCIITEPYGPADPDKPAEYRVYAKYPFGFPLLAAIGRWFGGWGGMYVINPICTIVACAFAYLMFRTAVSPFSAMVGVLWLACNPLTLVYANDANSHASTLMCVCVGFWGLLAWFMYGGWWRGFIGGLFLGYACTIRYSEFLLVLPVGFAVLANWRFNVKRMASCAAVLAGWMIPIAALAFMCWISFGSPSKTGYTYCREDTGFGWKYLAGYWGDGAGAIGGNKQGNWETLVQQLNRTGLFLMWSVALAGMIGMIGSAWRLGVTLALWVVPPTVLYMLYYWAPTGETTVGYLRFFLSVVPGLIFAGIWLIERGMKSVSAEKWPGLVMITLFGLTVFGTAAMYTTATTPEVGPQFFGQLGSALVEFCADWRGMLLGGGILVLLVGVWLFEREQAGARVGLALAMFAVTALGCGVNLYNITPQLEGTHQRHSGLRDTVDIITKPCKADDPRSALAPRGTVIFTDEGLCQQLDAVGGYKLYSTALFSPSAFAQYKGAVDRRDKDKDQQDDPNPLQHERAEFYVNLLSKRNAIGNLIAKGPDDLRQHELDIMNKAIAEGRRVMTIVPVRDGDNRRDIATRNMPTRAGFDTVPVAIWGVTPPTEGAAFWRWGGGANPRRPDRFAPGGRDTRANVSYALYEYVPKEKPKPATQATTQAAPATQPAAPTAPVNENNQPARPPTFFGN